MPFIHKPGLVPPPVGGFLKPHAPHHHFGHREPQSGVVLPENPNSIIRIKRSSSATEAPKLYAGELAYSWAEGVNKLWIGVGEGADGFAEQAVVLADGEGSAVIDALNRFFVFGEDGDVIGITADGGLHIAPMSIKTVGEDTVFTFGASKTIIKNLFLDTPSGEQVELSKYIADMIGDNQQIVEAIKAKIEELTLEDLNAEELVAEAIKVEKAERSFVDGTLADKIDAVKAELEKQIKAEADTRAYQDGFVADLIKAAKIELTADIDERYADAKEYAEAQDKIILAKLEGIEDSIGDSAKIKADVDALKSDVEHFTADLKQTEDDIKGILAAGDEALQVQIDNLKTGVKANKDSIEAKGEKLDAEIEARKALAVELSNLEGKVDKINSAPELVAGHGIELDKSEVGKITINAVDQVLPAVASADEYLSVKRVDNTYTVGFNVEKLQKTSITSRDGSVAVYTDAAGNVDLSVEIPEQKEQKKIESNSLKVTEGLNAIRIEAAPVFAKATADNNIEVKTSESGIELYVPRQSIPAVESADGSVKVRKVDGNFDLSVDIPEIEPVVASPKEGNVAEVSHVGGEYQVYVPASDKQTDLISEIDFIKVYRNKEGDYILKADAGDRSDDFADLTAKTLVSSNHSIIIRQDEERKTVDLMMPKIRSKDGSVKIEADPDNMELNLSVEMGGVDADEIADKVADKIENKVAEKVKKEVKEEIIDDLGEKVKEEIIGDVVSEVKESLGDEFAGEVAEKVQETLEIPVKDIKAKGNNVSVTKSNGVYTIAVTEPEVPTAAEIVEQVKAEIEIPVKGIEAGDNISISKDDDGVVTISADVPSEDDIKGIIKDEIDVEDLKNEVTTEINTAVQNALNQIQGAQIGFTDDEGNLAHVSLGGDPLKFVADGDAKVTVGEDNTVTIGVELPEIPEFDDTIGVADIVATTVGALNAGTPIRATQSVKDILKQILFKAVDISGLSMTMYDSNGVVISTGYERYKPISVAKVSLAWVPGNQGVVAESNISMTGADGYTFDGLFNGQYMANTSKSSHVNLVFDTPFVFNTDKSFAANVKTLKATKDVKFYLPVFYKAVAEVPSAETDVSAWSKATLGADKADQTLKIGVTGTKFVAIAAPAEWGDIKDVVDTSFNLSLDPSKLASWHRIETVVKMGETDVPYVIYCDDTANSDTTVNYKVKFK